MSNPAAPAVDGRPAGAAAATAAAEPQLGTGRVSHLRLRPKRHGFDYRTYFLLLPMRRLRAAPVAALARNRFALVGFHDRDHGDGRADSLAWLDERLAAEGIVDADGEVWLQCYPRVLGYVFKPVSFWFCHRTDGSLAAIVVEVNNTFGERHCYLLAGPQLAFGREQRARKVFYVSPFCSVAGDYRFRFMRTEPTAATVHPGSGSRRKSLDDRARCVARIEHHDDDGALLLTSLSGHLAPLTPGALLGAFFGMPLMTAAVVVRIHWQALRLWAKRVPILRKPEPPEPFMTR